MVGSNDTNSATNKEVRLRQVLDSVHTMCLVLRGELPEVMRPGLINYFTSSYPAALKLHRRNELSSDLLAFPAIPSLV